MFTSASTSVGARTASSAAPSEIDEPPANAAGAAASAARSAARTLIIGG
jgi:hypothetical protein